MTRVATIVAPATAPGEAGIGVLRLSGPDAEACLDTVFRGTRPAAAMRSHQLYHGHLVRPDGSLIDEVLVVIMRAPRSYTGEDVVEIHCHGGTQIMRSALDLLLETPARLAQPGEFTQRAFLNGRLDLVQAEAVIEVIRARSDRACRIAVGQLEGRLSRLVHAYADQLREMLLLLEAHIDFPDDEVGAVDLSDLDRRTTALDIEMTQLLASFDTGRVLREGLNILILGRPNVGKSSLMNALLGEARAIVTEIPGTTRDTLEERLVLGGLPIHLVDSAGVRETDDPIEQEGVRRARDKVASADLTLLVVDGSLPLAEEDRLALSLCEPDRTLLVINKGDLAQVVTLDDCPGLTTAVTISARHGHGLDALQQAILAQFDGVAADSAEDVVLTERRHREALLDARAALQRFRAAATTETPLECLALEIREALQALGQITGETTPDEILQQIFERFCIGK